MTFLAGANYRAVRRLSSKDDETLADAGDSCARVPVASLAWLLEQGHIEAIPGAVISEDVWRDLGRPEDGA